MFFHIEHLNNCTFLQNIICSFIDTSETFNGKHNYVHYPGLGGTFHPITMVVDNTVAMGTSEGKHTSVIHFIVDNLYTYTYIPHLFCSV